MRILLLPALALAFAFASCGGGSTSSGAGASGASTGLDSCEGVTCTVSTATLTLVVVDDMGQPVADPTFTENGQPLEGVCENDAGLAIPQDAGPCSSWNFYQVPVEPRTITINASGYEPAMVSLMFPTSMEPPFCSCYDGAPVGYTVTLQPAPADAGTD